MLKYLKWKLFFFGIAIGLAVAVVTFWFWKWIDFDQWAMAPLCGAVVPWIMSRRQYSKDENENADVRTSYALAGAVMAVLMLVRLKTVPCLGGRLGFPSVFILIGLARMFTVAYEGRYGYSESAMRNWKKVILVAGWGAFRRRELLLRSGIHLMCIIRNRSGGITFRQVSLGLLANSLEERNEPKTGSFFVQLDSELPNY